MVLKALTLLTLALLVTSSGALGISTSFFCGSGNTIGITNVFNAGLLDSVQSKISTSFANGSELMGSDAGSGDFFQSHTANSFSGNEEHYRGCQDQPLRESTAVCGAWLVEAITTSKHGNTQQFRMERISSALRPLPTSWGRGDLGEGNPRVRLHDQNRALARPLRKAIALYPDAAETRPSVTSSASPGIQRAPARPLPKDMPTPPPMLTTS